ncbi:hypothetical protein K7X08_011675 [Anisodus acutangulus]|uniref:Uncharacterized protein n=1 Tax=Anisodus acutangulus TaxID=402998 RepID=A0A9Q1RLI7_9SOLA|nr:hypothetical protein K7X08_011675 [Anisodus acutangulus]
MGFFSAQGVPTSYATDSGLEFEYILVGCGADDFNNLLMHCVLDKIIDCPFSSSLYGFVALQTCENDHSSLTVIGSELELVNKMAGTESQIDANNNKMLNNATIQEIDPVTREIGTRNDQISSPQTSRRIEGERTPNDDEKVDDRVKVAGSDLTKILDTKSDHSIAGKGQSRS